ncbi:MAG: TM2 domain-containing protein [Candidatus Eisenbacteria bacterium]|uniref:TM2 domain-containing protein n=1 Tax=Eiseniibacteriota bacterium TaxID=2212470 RepID=A0A956RNQ0_UNCEI|nr:TM2 domain-containing protein [Candidatus Eisenbacteria bacterium]
MSEKDGTTTLLLCALVGNFGAHRFYVGKTGSGVAMLLTLGGLGVWSLLDLIQIVRGQFTDATGNAIRLSKQDPPRDRQAA